MGNWPPGLLALLRPAASASTALVSDCIDQGLSRGPIKAWLSKIAARPALVLEFGGTDAVAEGFSR